MRDGHSIAVIIPVLNEAPSIGHVLEAIPGWVDDVIVADNGSTDGTPDIARQRGARVVTESRRGYGSACLRGMAALDAPDVVVFLDGDFSDYPEQMDRLVDPIVAGAAEMVIGSRVRGNAQPGALTPQARFGNRLATRLMRMFWGVRYTDLGPFRAIRYPALVRLGMADPDYGWTVEMQIKAALHKVSSTEVPIDYRRRIEGRSKVSGTVRGVIGAGYKILGTIFWSALKHYAGYRVRGESRRLIVFTRYPEPGKTKTRLIPSLGDEGAATLQRQMTEHAVRTARCYAGADIHVCYTGAEREAMEAWLGGRLQYAAQSDADLGERMRAAFDAAFDDGTVHVVITGVDSPEIDAATLEAAFHALRRHDLVLGPATDGGYYLIGLRQDASEAALSHLFQNMPWGSDSVYHETIDRAEAAGLRYTYLAPLDDVDRPEDLTVWERAQGREDRPRLSVIVPALNEAESLGETLDVVRATSGVEVIVVDGGSEDDTVSIAEAKGARVLRTSGGRAAQMNLGAARAEADTLCFLHADTRLPKNFATEIESTLGRPGTVAGAFHFATDYHSLSMRAITFFANLRARCLRLPYGDQALFMRKTDFRRAGGFRAWPIMEDYRLVHDIRRFGRITLAPGSAVTSGRRWRRLGPWRTVLINQMVLLRYRLGTPLERLARYYRAPR